MEVTVILSAPERLDSKHEASGFDSGEPFLDDWLKKHALANQAGGASRTFVSCADGRVVGYYALASGAISASAAAGNFRRNMPDPIPMVLLGRLAIDKALQGRGLGRALFRDAALRVMQAADLIGVRGIVVHALSDDAQKFYLALGFTKSPNEPMLLVVTLQDMSIGMQLERSPSG